MGQEAQGALCLIAQAFGGDPQGLEIIEAIESDDRIALLFGDAYRRFGLAKLIKDGRGDDIGRLWRLKLRIAQGNELHGTIGGKSGVRGLRLSLKDGDIGLRIEIV